MELTLDDLLRFQAQTGHDIVLRPVPELLHSLWQRAHAEGLHLGRFFVLTRPLGPRSGGSWNRVTGDVWVLWHPDAPTITARYLLHELAHAQLHTGQEPPRTIEEDWNREAEAIQGAHALAERWGMLDLVPDPWLDQELERIEQMRERCLAAADLAGHAAPHIARAALDGLLDLAHERGWSDEMLEAALYGVCDDDGVNEAVLDFDRCALRPSWSIGFGAGPGLAELALGGESARFAASWLRDALRRLASRKEAVAWAKRSWGGNDELPIHQVFVDLSDDTHLVAVLAACNDALLNLHLDRSALACWRVYADAGRTTRIYCLDVSYQGIGRDDRQPPRHEVWVLAETERGRSCTAAAAFERYLSGWQRYARINVLPLAEGLATLWSQLRLRGE